LQEVDSNILHTLNDFLYHHDAVEDPLVFYIGISEALFAATLAIICLAANGPRFASWRRTAVAAGLSAALGLAVGSLIAQFVDRARPFVSDPGSVHLFAAHSADAGFPSDHATAAFAIAVAIVLRKRDLGIFALLAASVLSVGRVAIGVHYPSDVIAGAALGAAAALALWIPPLRTRVDALADFAGGLWERLLAWGAARLGLAWRV
jgi:undecaprenyl-diphosphatase